MWIFLFFFFLVRVWIFILFVMLFFVFVDFWVWACLVICFVFCCFFLVFFTYMDFLFFKFNCSWRFFSSFGHVPLGVGCTAPPFRDRVSRVSELCNWWFWKAKARLKSFDECSTLKRRLSVGLGGRCLGVGQCPVAPPSGWSRRADLGDGVNFFFNTYISFRKSMEITGKMLEWRKVFLAQLLLGWNNMARGRICCDPPMRVSPDATHRQLLRLMMLIIAGSPLDMTYCWGWYEKWRCLKVLRYFAMWGWVEKFPPKLSILGSGRNRGV